MKKSSKTTNLPLLSPPSEKQTERFMFWSSDQWPHVAHPITWLICPINHVARQGNENGPGHMGPSLPRDIMSHKRAMILPSQWHNVDKPVNPETSDHTTCISHVHIYRRLPRSPNWNEATASVCQLTCGHDFDAGWHIYAGGCCRDGRLKSLEIKRNICFLQWNRYISWHTHTNI